MPPGIKYDMSAVGATPEVCNIQTIYRLTGGFNLEDDKLVSGSYLPPLAPMAIDFATRKAVAVKDVKVVEAADANATSLKIAKKSLAYVGMFLGTGTKGATVTAIDKSNAAYDVVTIDAALTVAVAVGQILFEASAAGGTTVKNKANFLNYARVKVETGATVTAIGQVFEIVESKLELPIGDKSKGTLGARFMFV